MNQENYKAIAKKIQKNATKEFLYLYEEENIWNTPLGFLAEDLADYFEQEAEGRIICRHCHKEIYFDCEELEQDYDITDGGEIIAKPYMRKIYLHSHTDHPICDSNKTGASPKDKTFDRQQFFKDCGLN